jgi:crotonobetainyl-CoA:carnitine CoA-transferase CaiB-like acyl-CoA transferase
MSEKLLLKGLKVIGTGSFIAGPVPTTILSELCPASAIVMTKTLGPAEGDTP